MDIVALCIWREARNQGIPGMTAVANVIVNRGKRHNQSPAQVVMIPYAFSSMTAHGDPQLTYYPKGEDTQYMVCEQLSRSIAAASIIDNTEGATLYYDDSIEFPRSWNPAKVKATVKIGRLNFFKEI